MEFKQCLKEKASFVEKVLKEYMPKEEGYQKTVIEAMNYSLSAGGKRLRPILTLEACKIVGGNEDEAIPFAIAIEMIHTYSLIHDDLPALDNDDLRRGRPTNHKVYGEAMGILAGDALLNYAFEVMLAGSINKENPEKYLKAINEIAKGAGIYGMIGGQVVDVESENKQIEKEKLDYIHMNKTAKNIGLSFQIVDDILDIVGDEAKLGKKVGSDIENHKSTYPSLLGLDKSKEIAHNLIDEAKKSIEKLSDDVDFLKGLAEYIIDREY